MTLALAGCTSLLAMAVAPSALASQRSGLPYVGGPVLHSSRPYLIFWTPPSESIPAGSESLIERFFADVAADSGKSSNVFGVLRQYYDRTGFADYRQTFDPARQVIVDTQPYPPYDATHCPDRGLYRTCIHDPQIQSELQRLITADHLPSNRPGSASELSAGAPIYFVILPADVEFCYVWCPNENITGYHQPLFGSHVLYGVVAMDPLRGVSLPAPISGECDPGGTGMAQEPNGDPGDCAINWLSHEESETITDPLHNGWTDATSWETGDFCATIGPLRPAKMNPDAFLPTLGGSAAAGTLYTQLINGHPYYIQSEWSTGDRRCEMRPTAGRIEPRFRVRGRTSAGTPVSFNPAPSTSMNPLSSATWNFGDGSRTSFYHGNAALTPAKHRYRRSGRYTVTLKLVDNRGNLQTATRRVTIHAR